MLSDPQKRQLYDRFGHAGLGGAGAPGFGDIGDVFSQFQDIFGDLFGGGGGFGFGGFGRQRRDPNGPARGADIRTDVSLSLREAAFGASARSIFRTRRRAKPAAGPAQRTASSRAAQPAEGAAKWRARKARS